MTASAGKPGSEHSAQLRARVLAKAMAAILGGAYFMVTPGRDSTYPLIYGWLPLDDVK